MPNNELEHRYLIALGESEYDHPDFQPLKQVIDDIKRVAEFFTGKTQGYQRVLADEIGLNASADAIRASVKQWFASPERRATDRVIFYFAGHGDMAGQFGFHYLFTKTSNPRDPSNTAIASQDLSQWFFEGENERPQNVLLILDTCYAGKGAGQAAAVATRAAEAIFKDTKEGLWIMASARPLDEAAEGGFVDAFLAVTEDLPWGDRSQPFINPVAVTAGVNDWFEDHDLIQRADGYAVAFRANPEFIRNIKYCPGQTGLVLTDETHWDPKARGTESITEVGWYFTGRHAALRTLVGFLVTAHSGCRARLVTGSPGSGKSAVLSRLVTCAHPETRKRLEEAGMLNDVSPEELAPVNSIDVAIHARGQSIDQVAAAIASACGLADSDPVAVLKALSTREKPLRIVIDALDEAQKPDALDQELLRPLAELPAVRLIVGSRCQRKDRPPLGERAEVLDLDENYFDETDIADYVTRRLQRRDPATPYAYLGNDEIASIARAVAHKAQKSFLFARVVGRRLADADRPIDVRSPGWQEQLPTSISEAFEQDLDRFPKDRRDAFFDLMVPLAYARGRGLPWQNLWSRLASAIAGHEYTNRDISDLRESAGYYLIEDADEGVSVYRLFHEEFAHYLRDETSSQDNERTIAETLIHMVPNDNTGLRWERVYQPYIFAHLSTHAAQTSGLLDSLIVDSQYLIRADPVRLWDAIDVTQPNQHRSEEAREFREVYRLAQHHLRRTQDVDERAAYVELTAHIQKTPHVITAFRALPSRSQWRVVWAHARPMISHQVIEGHGKSVTAVSLGERRDGRRVIVSGSKDKTVRLWDLYTGEPLLPPLMHDGEVVALALGKRGDGRRVIVSAEGYGASTLRIWDLDTGEMVVSPLKGHRDSVIAVMLEERSDGRCVIISGSWDETLRVWDLDTGVSLLPPLKGHSDVVSAMALGKRSDGRSVIVSGSQDKTLRVWDLDTGAPLLPPLEGHRKSVRAVALGERSNGERVIVSGSWDRTVRIWNLDTGKPLIQPLSHDQGVLGLALGERNDGRRVIVSGCSHGGPTHVWDLDTGAPLFPPLPAGGAANQLTLFETDAGRRVVVTGGGGTLRVWDLDSGSPLSPPLEGHSGYVSAVAVGKHRDDRPMIVSGGTEGTIRVWDLESEESLLKPLDRYGVAVSNLALGERADGRTLIVSGCGDGAVRVWDLENGELVLPPLEGHDTGSWVQAVALGKRGDGQRVIVSGGYSSLRIWDLDSGIPLLSPLEGGDGGVGQVALVERGDGRCMIVSYHRHGKLKAWDLESGAPMPLDLEGFVGAVGTMVIGEWGDGRRVIVAGVGEGHNSAIRVWDLDTGTLLLTLWQEYGGGVSAMALGVRNDGRRVIISAVGTAVRVWDLRTGEVLLPPLMRHDPVIAVAVGERSDGRRVIVSGSSDGTVQVWDLDSGQPLLRVTGSTPLSAAALYRGTLVLGDYSSLLAFHI